MREATPARLESRVQVVTFRVIAAWTFMASSRQDDVRVRTRRAAMMQVS
jgi:hypothetical protein